MEEFPPRQGSQVIAFSPDEQTMYVAISCLDESCIAEKERGGVCHAPMTYFLGHWKTGFSGGLRMGLGLGAFCVGCCWGFMALGFVGGAMSLLWMGLATLFMVLEKLPEIGHAITRPMGFALIAGGIALLIYPFAYGG